MRWATFDCYGTLIDWDRGIREALLALWPDQDASALLQDYHALEPAIQEGSELPYREVLARCASIIAAQRGLPLAPGAEGTLAGSLPGWPPFPEVPGSLDELRARGWKIAILSNTDPDLLAASIRSIGVPPDLTITVAEAGSYKPAHGHWNAFRERAGTVDGHVHVGASVYHDLVPAAAMRIPAIWINRLGGSSDVPRAAELSTLDGLADVLDRIAAV